MTHTTSSIAKKLSAIVAVGALCLLANIETVHAVSSWNPTLLVNTESFQMIDAGDGTSDIELRFGTTTNTLKFLTTGKFSFSTSLRVVGNLSGSTLNVDGYAGIYGGLTVSGSTVLRSNTKVRGNLSGSTLRTDGNADIWGNLGVSGSTVLKGAVNIRNSGGLNASGAILTNGDLTINSDNAAADSTITFGHTTSQTLKYLSATTRFQLSKGLSVIGNLSGSTLTVDGTTTMRSLSYTWPSAHGASGTVLGTNGAGVLTWTRPSAGSSSGEILSLVPQYRNGVYFQSGSTAVGSLTSSGSGVSDNYYRWASSRGTLQDYWIGVRVQVPKNFTHFETASGITLRLRSLTTNTANNYLTARVIDTAGSTVNIGNNATQVSTVANTWRLHTITGITNGTYTPGGYMTVLLKLAATSSGLMDVGTMTFNWSNTTP